MSVTPEPPEVEEDEVVPPAAEPRQDKVWLWRLDTFTRLGFSDPDAAALADSAADLDKARHIVRDLGCPLPLAFRYLSD